MSNNAASPEPNAVPEPQKDMRTEKLLLDALKLIYDKWENGTPCQEADEDGQCYEGSNCGNAFKLSEEEENSILRALEAAGEVTALSYSKRFDEIAKLTDVPTPDPLPSQGEGGQDRLSRAEELLRLMLADDEMVAANSYGRRDNPKSIEREWKRMWPDQFKLGQSVRDFLYAKESSQTPAPTRRAAKHKP